VKQGMNKKQAYATLKARPGTIDHIRVHYNLPVLLDFFQERKCLLNKNKKLKTELTGKKQKKKNPIKQSIISTIQKAVILLRPQKMLLKT
jgi:hypothetical protein